MSGRKKILLEICAYSAEAAIPAQAAGADRVELCTNRVADGTTPSIKDIALAREQLRIPLHVMIRPRGGDFVYSNAEFAQMKRDIQTCRQLDVNGVVLGILLPNGEVDKKRCRELVHLAAPMSATFHRAFDVTPDPSKSLEDIVDVGCARILTSGQASSALQGSSVITRLVEEAAGRIIVMPGGGVRSDHFAQLVEATGASEFHSSACLTGEMPDQDQIKKMREIADQFF